MDNISLSIPAYLSNFSTQEDGRTRAKLKTFYIGVTPDGREFDEDFAKALEPSFPYTPIVSFYSDIKDDFIGHNSKQNIFGIVPADTSIKYEEEDGKKWCVVDVLLYTDRGDNIGDIAKKIVGHPHSLELDPKGIEYEVYSKEGKRVVKFKKARLCGLSVLGLDQTPAFTGSEFFGLQNNFAIAEQDIPVVRERFENFLSCLEENSRGGQDVNKENFESFANFVKLSYNEKMKKAVDELHTQLGDDIGVCLLDMDDKSFVVEKFDFRTYDVSYARYDYSLSDTEFSISNERAVFRKFLTVAEIEALENAQAAKESDEKEENYTASEEPEKDEKDDDKEIENAESVDKTEEEEEPKKDENCEAHEDKQNESTEEEEKDKDEDGCPVNATVEDKDDVKEEGNEPSEEDDKEPKNTCTSSLSDSERIEFEALKREKKERLIASYEEMLDKDTLDTFYSTIDEYDFDTLEAKLAIAFVKYSKEQPKQVQQIPYSFGSAIKTEKDPSQMSYAERVKRIIGK